MKRKINLVPFMLLLFFGCSVVAVETNYEKGTNFGQYKSFTFMQIQQQFIRDTALTQPQINIIEDAITKELELKGLQPSNNADLNINIGIQVVEKTQKREQTVQDIHYMGQRRYSWSASDSIVVGHYKEGTMIIDLVDAQKKLLVWRGIGKRVVTGKGDFEEKVREAVQKILEEYPPKQ